MAVEQRELIKHQGPEAIYDAIEARHRRPFAYRSPFEAFPGRHPQVMFEESERYMRYKGTVGSVLDELAVALASPQENFARIALHPPRLIRAAMDWKINHPDSNGEPLILNAIQAGLAIYQRRPEAVALLQDFRHKIVATRPEMLTAAIEQTEDFATWDASDPGRSYESARKLAFELEGQDILFIALGHGGTAAGMDVFLRYADIAPSANSAFYVIRFSRRKMEDRQPRVSDVETAYLRELTLGRQVVVFDEDSSTGTTLNEATCYFGIEIFPERDITVCKNLRLGGISTKNNDCYEILISASATVGFQNPSNFKPEYLLNPINIPSNYKILFNN